MQELGAKILQQDSNVEHALLDILELEYSVDHLYYLAI